MKLQTLSASGQPCKLRTRKSVLHMKVAIIRWPLLPAVELVHGFIFLVELLTYLLKGKGLT